MGEIGLPVRVGEVLVHFHRQVGRGRRTCRILETGTGAEADLERKALESLTGPYPEITMPRLPATSGASLVAE